LEQVKYWGTPEVWQCGVRTEERAKRKFILNFVHATVRKKNDRLWG